jgi:hypothetical protein
VSVTEAVQQALACIIINDPVHYESICHNHKAPVVNGQCALAAWVASRAMAAMGEA